MHAWGFVFLAYGIVWSVLIGYFLKLKQRLKKAQDELEAHSEIKNQ